MNTDTRYGYFYPENNEGVLVHLSFASVEEAVDWWRDRRYRWQELKPAGDDKAMFLSPLTGGIVVVREIKPQATAPLKRTQ